LGSNQSTEWEGSPQAKKSKKGKKKNKKK